MKKFIENLKGIALDKNFGAKVPLQSPNAAILFLVVLIIAYRPISAAPPPHQSASDIPNSKKSLK